MEEYKIIIIVAVLIIVYVLIEYNTLVRLRAKIKRSTSLIDVYSKQRFDLIPNLVEVVKGYANYEKEAYEKIIKLRNTYNETKDLNTASELNNSINHLLALAENYPELKASEQFLNLQKNLSKMENQLQAARRIYNMDVTTYNTRIETLPHNIFAKIFGFKKEKWFELNNAKEKENIKVNLE